MAGLIRVERYAVHKDILPQAHRLVNWDIK